MHTVDQLPTTLRARPAEPVVTIDSRFGAAPAAYRIAARAGHR